MLRPEKDHFLGGFGFVSGEAGFAQARPQTARATIGTPSVITSGNSTTDGTSVATASITPAIGDLAIVCSGSGGATEPTCSGGGLTWTQVADELFPGTAIRRMSVFRATSGTPSAGALTFDYGASTISSWAWAVVRVANYDAIQQVKETEVAASIESIEATLDGALEHPNNAMLALVGFAGATITPDADFDVVAEVSASTATIRLSVFFDDDGETTCTCVLSAAGNGGAMTLLELRAAAA